jgi:hypothetical protein
MKNFSKFKTQKFYFKTLPLLLVNYSNKKNNITMLPVARLFTLSSKLKIINNKNLLLVPFSTVFNCLFHSELDRLNKIYYKYID